MLLTCLAHLGCLLTEIMRGKLENWSGVVDFGLSCNICRMVLGGTVVLELHFFSNESAKIIQRHLNNWLAGCWRRTGL